MYERIDVNYKSIEGCINTGFYKNLSLISQLRILIILELKDSWKPLNSENKKANEKKNCIVNKME